MRLQPLHSQVLIKPISHGDVSKGGLLIPQVARNNAPYRYGDVVEVGTGRVNAEGKTVGLAVKVGDVVAYAKNAGLEVPIEMDGGEFTMLLVDEKYILGIAHGLRRPSSIVGLDGRLTMMEPVSRGVAEMADSVYVNQAALDKAEKDFGIDTSDHIDEPRD